MVIFNRTLGIADFDVTQKDNGGLSVVGKLWFGQKEIEDLEAVFESLPPYEVGKTMANYGTP